MTDTEHAVILRRICDSWPYHGPTFAKEHAAIERAIVLLEREAERVSLLNTADGLLGLVLYRGEGKGDTTWEADAKALIEKIRQTLKASQ